MTNITAVMIEIANSSIPPGCSESQASVLQSFAGLIACKFALKLLNDNLTLSPSLTDEDISALEDIKDNLHVLSEGDDTSPHCALIDKLLAGRSTRGRSTSTAR